jgi:hypothetical protein
MKLKVAICPFADYGKRPNRFDPVMAQSAKSQVPSMTPPAASPAETARYTRELLESLRKIAMRQNQELLAHLLELARFEAQSLASPATTRTPDSLDDGHSVPPVPVPAEP